MNNIERLHAAGTSAWLDDLSRERLESGDLAAKIARKEILGVTTNPAIFAKAITSSSAYDQQLAELKAAGATPEEAVTALMIADVQAACDLFLPLYEETHGQDGRVSLEVDPRLAYDADATKKQALVLWKKINRPNAMIKIPATKEAIPVIEYLVGKGVDINVTLIFSPTRYLEVVHAYAFGIKHAQAETKDISWIHSVASFFVSRLDTVIDQRLTAIGTPEAQALRGQAGIANARVAYGWFAKFFGGLCPVDTGTQGSGSFAALSLPDGFQLQRLLWASTGVKNPDYPPTLYVDELSGPHSVNTMPEATLQAVLAAPPHEFADGLNPKIHVGQKVIAELKELGIDVDYELTLLERAGIKQFIAAWEELLADVTKKLA